MSGPSRPTLQETLRQRLPGQRAPPDPAVATANAADLTYGWHADASSDASSSSNSLHSDAEGEPAEPLAPPDWRAERMARLKAHGVDLDEPEGAHERIASSDSDDARQAERQADAEPAPRIRRRRRSSSAASSACSSANSAHAQAEAEAREAKAGEGSGAAQQAAPEQPAAEQAEARPDEDLICRICFDGPSANVAGGERLGKLIAPCRCRGTMKFVHTSCLTSWRMASRRSTSAMQCDQCGQPYRFRQSRFVGFAQSPILLFIVSVPLFLMLIWAIGLTTDVALRSFGGGVATEPASSRWNLVPGGDYHSNTWIDDLGEENSYFELGYDSWAQSRAFLKMAKAGLTHVKKGGVITALAELQGDEERREARRLTQRQAERSKVAKRGWWSELKWVWANGEDEEDEVDERYEDRHSGSKNREAQEDEDDFTSSSWAQRIALQFSLGFSVVGVSSFLTMLLSMPLLHLGNFGLGRGFVRMTGGRRRGNGRGGGQNGQGGDVGAIATAVLLFLVFLGVMRALHLVYRGVRAYTRRMLSRIEDIIIDRGETEAEKEERRAHEAQRAPQPGLRERLANVDVKAKLLSSWQALRERMAPAQVPPAAAAGAAE